MNNFTRNITAAFAVLTIALGATTLQAAGKPIPGVYIQDTSFISATMQDSDGNYLDGNIDPVSLRSDHEEEIDIHDIMWNIEQGAAASGDDFNWSRDSGASPGTSTGK